MVLPPTSPELANSLQTGKVFDVFKLINSVLFPSQASTTISADLGRHHGLGGVPPIALFDHLDLFVLLLKLPILLRPLGLQIIVLLLHRPGCRIGILLVSAYRHLKQLVNHLAPVRQDVDELSRGAPAQHLPRLLHRLLVLPLVQDDASLFARDQWL